MPFATSSPKPILKWAGGKRNLASDILSRLPRKINTYYEPFLGGGAVFLSVQNSRKIKKAVLSDINGELINVYECAKNNIDSVESLLRQMSAAYYLIAKEEDRKKYYLEIRNSKPKNNNQAAARTIFLNKTCFNGLYRTNKSGQFNVPFGKYANPKIVDAKNLRKVSLSLQKAMLVNDSFEKVVKKAKSGDVVYFDPPYYPVKADSFVSYNGVRFDQKEHVKLHSVFENLKNKGVFVVETTQTLNLSETCIKNTKL